MSVAEVAIAGLVGVGGPGVVAFLREIVVVLLLGDNDDLLLRRGAGEKALIDESVVALGLGVVGGGGLDGEFLGLGPEAGGPRLEVTINRVGVVGSLGSRLVAGCGRKDDCRGEG